MVGFIIGGGGFRYCIGFRDGGFVDLETSDPDFAVSNCEAHYVIDKRFGFAGAFWNAEDMREEFLNQG